MKISVDDWGGFKFVNLDSSNIDECMKYYFNGQADGIMVHPYGKYKKNDLAFLKKYKNIKRFIISYGDKIDISLLPLLQEVEYLGVFDKQQAIDYRIFKNLKELRITWHKRVDLPEKSNLLTSLYLHAYSPANKSLAALPDYRNLESLEFLGGSIETLSGFKRFQKLQNLTIIRLLKLRKIFKIEKLSGFINLHLELCKKIQDANCIAKLETLFYVDNGELSSIKFLSKMKSLEKVFLRDANVLDGNVLPLSKLKIAGFSNKRHYSHTSEQIDALIESNKII
ncbi:hypothetical protein EHQ52_13080 [Leptospira koniambonensis]|uniref:Leucine-rich repeat domain-containing protein n=1 Tax=Leptospira koniambonensis TaxID=2484950 RepID=A0A4R9JBP3_9LEPT|nr:hypothetical protein [Leptospira koniambonensis]TGL35392.1 hypothetical protein EHQ52_13080 [Leptospira koniambonensis]